MKFLDLWRFWRQKERGFNQSTFSTSKSDGDLSTTTSGSNSIWSRKRKTLKIKKSKRQSPKSPPAPTPSAPAPTYNDGSDSGHVTASPPLRAKFLRKDNFLRQKDRAPRFREAQKFWERKIKSQRTKKCFECRSRMGSNKVSSRQMCQRCEVAIANPCRQCQIPITGPIIVIGEFRFHPECFVCSRCTEIIGTDEKYSIIEASRLFCERCVSCVISLADLGSSTNRFSISSVSSPKMSSSKSTSVTTVVTCRSTNDLNKLGNLVTLSDSSGQVLNLDSEGGSERDEQILTMNGVIVDRSNMREMVIRMANPTADETVKFIVQRNKNVYDASSRSSMPPSPTLSRSETPRSSFKRPRRKVLPLSQSSLSDGSDFEDESAVSMSCRPRKTTSLQLIPRGTEVDDLPGSSRSDGSDSETGFYLESRGMERVESPSTPVSRHGSISHRSNAFLSQQTSPILTRHRSLTASQVIRKRFQRKFDDTRRSSVELSSNSRSSERASSIFARGVFRNIESKDLSRSESMRLGTMNKEGVPLYRVFRPCDLIIGETLGEGFFASAIKVTHRDTSEVMVLKQLHRNTEEDDAYANFLKEVKVLRSIQHKNVLRFIGVLYKDRKMNLITEFIECGTLKEHIQNSQEFTWSHRMAIARDISAGMEYLHRSSIIHRDLNSNNCLVKEDGSVVVADFGLARWTRPEEEMIERRRNRKLKKRTKSKKYNAVGSPFWMAPEMLSGIEYDERIDIFSFGIILCEIIGRVDPDPDFLPRTTGFGLAVAQYYVQFALKFGCPKYFFAIAVRCCEIDPEMRPSFEELHSWYELLMRRKRLPKLPIPPHVMSVRNKVFADYDLERLHSVDDLSESFEESSCSAQTTTEDSCISN